MSDNSKIEWTDATTMIDRAGRRVRTYQRIDISRPGQQERRVRAAAGEKWCRACGAWLTQALVGKNGLCRPHANADARRRYACDPVFRQERKAHAQRRKRGVDPVPPAAAEMLTEIFDGRCAYCPAPATTFDHFDPVIAGGRTVPGNVFPACVPCNSSKGGRDPITFLDRAIDAHPAAVELLHIAGRL